MKKIALLLCCVMLVSMAGCGTKIQGEDLMDGKTPGQVSEVTELDGENVILTDFGVRLFKESYEDHKNTLISPLSVMYALAMTANGAKGETLEEMEAVLGMPVEELNTFLYSYAKNLPQDKKYKLSMANSIWFKDDASFNVNEDFLQTNADYYGAGIYKAPFNEQTVKDINSWVKQNTDEMIPEILDEIPAEAVMYLVNALAFEAEWETIYNEYDVRDGEFTLINGVTQNVEYMYGEEHTYLEDENTTGFLKYYKDGKYAFAALLPKEATNIVEYVKQLDGAKINKLLENKKSATVMTAIPKFETEYDISLKEVLESMGMKKAFNSSQADFTGLGTFTDKNIFMSRVLHKTFISVNEKGTKAGAATAVEMSAEGAIEVQNEVYLKRPFVYLLIDCETNTPFFIGATMHVTDENMNFETSVNRPADVVECKGEGYWFTLEIPDNWECEIGEFTEEDYYDFGLYLWPKGEKEGRLAVLSTEMFAVCGTGLETEKVMFGDFEANQGTYDGKDVWDFMAFTFESRDFVAWNEGMDAWWSEYGEEAMNILSTIEVYDELH